MHDPKANAMRYVVSSENIGNGYTKHQLSNGHCFLTETESGNPHYKTWQQIARSARKKRNPEEDEQFKKKIEAIVSLFIILVIAGGAILAFVNPDVEKVVSKVPMVLVILGGVVFVLGLFIFSIQALINGSPAVRRNIIVSLLWVAVFLCVRFGVHSPVWTNYILLVSIVAGVVTCPQWMGFKISNSAAQRLGIDPKPSLLNLLPLIVAICLGTLLFILGLSDNYLGLPID